MIAFRTCRAVAVGTAWRSTAAMPARLAALALVPVARSIGCRRPEAHAEAGKPVGDHLRIDAAVRGGTASAQDTRSACRRTADRETRSPGRTADREGSARARPTRRRRRSASRIPSRASCRSCRWDPCCRRWWSARCRAPGTPGSADPRGHGPRAAPARPGSCCTRGCSARRNGRSTSGVSGMARVVPRPQLEDALHRRDDSRFRRAARRGKDAQRVQARERRRADHRRDCSEPGRGTTDNGSRPWPAGGPRR